MDSPLAPIKQAFEQIVADLDSAEEWAKRTDVGHIHARLDQARMEARAALSLLAEMEKGAEVLLRIADCLYAEDAKTAGGYLLRDQKNTHRVLVFPLPEPGAKP